jgi:UDP-3-O-[3-hydroxymyristoyl] glucosamine N-acyltransferase
MPIPLADLLHLVAKQAPELEVRIERGENLPVARFSSLLQAVSGEIAFLASPKYTNQLCQTQASAVVLNQGAWDAHQGSLAMQGIVITNNPYAFFAFASQILHAHSCVNENATVHSSAVIHPSASIGSQVQIAAFACIDANAVIGDGCRIGSHVVVGEGAQLAADTTLYSHVTLYHGVQIGARCIIHSGTVIGSDGFGFAPYQKRWIKIPQTGTVCIGDDVEIGSNCSIDRGALGDTVIGRGTKLDNLIQIAHNVQVGEDCAFAANIAIAGSAVIGNRVQMGGKAGVLGHLSVCDDTVISSCTLVTKTINKPGFYTGVYPIQDNADWEKNAVSLKRLNTLREQVKALEKTVALQLTHSAENVIENEIEK